MSDSTQDSEQDFNVDDYNSFYYTSDKYIKKMDDKFIMSKIIEKYPDFIGNKCENIIKQAFVAIASDLKFIEEIANKFDTTIFDIFKVIYRNYSFIFNKCFINKIHKIIKVNGYELNQPNTNIRTEKFAIEKSANKKNKRITKKSRRRSKASKIQSNKKRFKDHIQTKKCR